MKPKPFNANVNDQLLKNTSRVSHPPMMLRPRPTLPLTISIVVSLPATTGQLLGSEVRGEDPNQSLCPVGDVCLAVKNEDEEETGWVREDVGDWEQGHDRDFGRDGVKKRRLWDLLTESLTLTCWSRINLDTWTEKQQVGHESSQDPCVMSLKWVLCVGICTFSTDIPDTGSSPTAMILSPLCILPSCIQTEIIIKENGREDNNELSPSYIDIYWIYLVIKVEWTLFFTLPPFYCDTYLLKQIKWEKDIFTPY